MAATRARYLAHIETILTLAKIPDAKAKAARVFALEKTIAAVHATRTESADVKRGNNPWMREEFAKRAPGLDWPACFRAAGLDNVPHFIVWHPGAVRGSAALAGSEPIETWRDYLTFHVIDRNAGYLPKAFAEASFAFYGKELTGAQQPRARWKRAIDATNDALGDAGLPRRTTRIARPRRPLPPPPMHLRRRRSRNRISPTTSSSSSRGRSRGGRRCGSRCCGRSS